MSATRIMLLGAGGQLGQALRAEALPAGWTLLPLTRAEADIADHRAIQQRLREARPDIVINAAAMTAVDRCETDQDAAVAANFEGPANLAAQCSALDIPLIHISTDYVFDGRDGATPYRPDSPMNPLNVYGNTKMMGEESIRHEHAWHSILRVSSVFSAFGGNILTRTLDMLEQREEIKSVTDQITGPTYAPDIAKALLTMTAAIQQGSAAAFGTFHLAGAGAASRFDFTQYVMQAYAPHTAKRPRILPAVTADFPGLAQRPAYSVLDCAKTTEVFGIVPRDWRRGVDEAISQLGAARGWRAA